jgi:hypothetical protein
MYPDDPRLHAILAEAQELLELAERDSKEDYEEAAADIARADAAAAAAAGASSADIPEADPDLPESQHSEQTRGN